MKRTITLLASLALVASGLHILPAVAAEPPAVPDVVNIEDPFGDANTMGDDQVTPGRRARINRRRHELRRWGRPLRGRQIAPPLHDPLPRVGIGHLLT